MIKKKRRKEFNKESRKNDYVCKSKKEFSKNSNYTLKSLNLSTEKKVILCVAEKNSVAKEITQFLCKNLSSLVKIKTNSLYNPAFSFPYQFLGNECNMIVTSVCGHIKQLEFDSKFLNWHSINPALLLDLSTPVVSTIKSDSQDIFENLTYFSKFSTYLILWLDCDREGENIAFEVASVCMTSNPNLIIFRAHFSAITRADIENAMNKLSFPNRALSEAVEARKEIDLRVGSAFTRFLTLRYKKICSISDQALSYGTCQFPTLGFIVRKFNQVLSFSEENVWSITLKVYTTYDKQRYLNSIPLKFEWERGRIFDHISAIIIYEICIENPTPTITDVDQQEKIKNKPLPLNTTEMTKLASKKLKISSFRCMKIAEELYQKGYISYPRTETNSFSETINLNKYIEKQIESSVFGEYSRKLLYSNMFSAPRKGNKDDGSHPPIHPVKCLHREKASSSDEWLLYELITRHFLAVCSKDAVLHEITVRICISNENFKFKGSAIIEENWLSIYPYEKVISKDFPKFELGILKFPFEICLIQTQTEPPSLLSESELIDLMDKNGIGTDATMHEHIEKIQTRNYVKKNSKFLFSPTVLGCALFNGFELISQILNSELKETSLNLENKEFRFHHNLMDPEIRKTIEHSISKISLGEYTRYFVVEQIMKFMKNIYDIMITNIEQLDSSLNHFFSKLNLELLLNSEKIALRNTFECEFCGSEMELLKISENSDLSTIFVFNKYFKLYNSKELNIAICAKKLSKHCEIPLIMPKIKRFNNENLTKF